MHQRWEITIQPSNFCESWDGSAQHQGVQVDLQRGQQGTWSNWRPQFGPDKGVYRMRMPLAACEARASDLCGWSDWKRRHRGAWVGRVCWNILGTWGGWPLLSGVEKNHTASKMDRQQIGEKPRIHVFCSVLLPDKKGSKTFFEPFFSGCLIFFHCQGQYFKDNKDGFGIFTWARPLVTIHWLSSTEAPITEADGRRYEGYWSKGGWSPMWL